MGRGWCLPAQARSNEDEVFLHREPPSRAVLPVSVVLDLGAVVEPPNAGFDLLGLRLVEVVAGESPQPRLRIQFVLGVAVRNMVFR